MIALAKADPIDFEAEYKRRKPMTKKEVLKLKPHTFIRVKWRDAEDQTRLLLEKPSTASGEVSLFTIGPDGRDYCNWQVTNRQVMGVVSPMTWPDMPVETSAMS